MTKVGEMMAVLMPGKVETVMSWAAWVVSVGREERSVRSDQILGWGVKPEGGGQMRAAPEVWRRKVWGWGLDDREGRRVGKGRAKSGAQSGGVC